MTVNDFIKELENLRPSLKEKEIVVIAPNGLEFEPSIKMQWENPVDMFDKDKEPEKMVLTY